MIDAFLDGLERARQAGHDLASIASVASFFVSRVDTEVDARLDKIGTAAAAALRGRAAIANARLAYQHYEQMLASPRWAALAAAGARPQRPLWASTSVKDPAYPDTMYVTKLVAPGVVNTMPEATLRAVADHGQIPADSIRGHYARRTAGAQPAGRGRRRLRRRHRGPGAARPGIVRRQLAGAERSAGRPAAPSMSSLERVHEKESGNEREQRVRDRRGGTGRGEGRGDPARRRVRRPGRADRGRDRTALRAAAAVQGLPAGQGRTRHDLRPPGVVVRRQRRRAAPRRAGDRHRPRGARGGAGRRQPDRLRQAAAGHRVLAAAPPGAGRRRRRRAVPAPGGRQRPDQGHLPGRLPDRGHRRGLDRPGDAPPRPARPASRSPSWRRPSCRCCGCSAPRSPGSSPACTASTASTCGSACR